MATTSEFIEYVYEQIADIGNVRYRKMFGEYTVYVNDKPVLLVCDDTVFVKKLECIKKLMKENYAEVGHPYKGAKEHYILDIDNQDFSIEVINLVETVSKVPKPKKSKSKIL